LEAAVVLVMAVTIHVAVVVTCTTSPAAMVPAALTRTHSAPAVPMARVPTATLLPGYSGVVAETAGSAVVKEKPSPKTAIEPLICCALLTP
jgi:hypothetical protein